MIGTEFLQGQGLGNRLFCYITARSVAATRGDTFATAGQEWLRADFLDLDLGEKLDHEKAAAISHYHEHEERLYLPTSAHDMVHGIFVAGADENILNPDKLPGDVLLEGNLQAQSYFASYKEEIRQWLRVKPEYESNEYTADDLCILNVRGGEYENKPELYLRKKYWQDAMACMKEENPAMRFMIITDDVEQTKKLLPGIECHHFSPEKDYVTVKNARYLIISNSSFAFFPAYTSTTVRKVIAPQYWARHNVSGGYWASEQNIYDGFWYLGRDGKLRSATECRRELQDWKERMAKQAKANTVTLKEGGETVSYVWGTRPWKADDPDVAAIARRNARRRKIEKAIAKLQRLILHK